MAVAVVLLLSGLLISAEWRFKLSYSNPVAALEGDRGFRLRIEERLCRNLNEEEGRSEGFFGECGDLRKATLRRIKLRSHIAIASSVRETTFEDSFIEWLEAQVSRWDQVRFVSSKLWDSEFQSAVLEGVIFDSADLRGVSFREAKLSNVTFRNTQMADVSFRGARLSGVKFENTTCRLCDFSDAKMGDTKLDIPFQRALFSLKTELSFPYEQVGKYGFELRD